MNFQPKDSGEASFTGEEATWETPKPGNLFPCVVSVTSIHVLDRPLANKMFVAFENGKTQTKKMQDMIKSVW